MKRVLLFLIPFLFLPVVFSSEITMKLNQSEYYFLVGEQAVINLNLENTYDRQISGMLSYTIMQEINQQGFHYSSSNTQSRDFAVDRGDSSQPLGFGTSDKPMDLTVSFSFAYEGKESRIDDLLIHFVSDQSQQKQNNEQKESTQQNSMQQKLDEMLNKQEELSDTEKKLQNNQVSQDSSALKQQMQKQMQENQKMQEEFQRQLSQNEELAKKHQEMLDQGYEFKGGKTDPVSNNTGTFDLDYQKGEDMQKLSGEMQDGEMKSIESTLDQQKMLENLKNDPKYQELMRELDGYEQTGQEITKQGNMTTMRQEFQKGNETAAVVAEFDNTELEEVKLEKKRNYFWVVPLVLLVAAAILYMRRPKKAVSPAPNKYTKPFDYAAEARRLLQLSKKLYSQKEYKEAYGTAAQSLRMYLSYKNGLAKELTNFEMISHMRTHNMNYKSAKQCFDLCSLVEFAKYKPNRNDFNQISTIVERSISGEKFE